jgi:hypothetical protein
VLLRTQSNACDLLCRVETWAISPRHSAWSLLKLHLAPSQSPRSSRSWLRSATCSICACLFELAQEVPNRKRHRRLRSKKVVPEIYTGAQAIFSICEGNPRWLIGLIRPLLDAYKEGRRVEGSGIVQRAQQARRTPVVLHMGLEIYIARSAR